MTRPRRPRRAIPSPRPADAARDAYHRGEGTNLLTCTLASCGAAFLDDGPGRAAHRAVFGHQPKAPAPGGTR